MLFRRLSKLLPAALAFGQLAGGIGDARADEPWLNLFDPDRAEISGFVEAELRIFPEDGLSNSQDYHLDVSGAVRPEFYLEWGDYSLIATPFFRADQQDSKRTHGDIREFLFQTLGDDWEFRVGIGQVFWGVTEARHVVDIINQSDLVEDPKGEEKLGQPLLNFTLLRDWGTLDLFVLPGFRERTFPGKSGRLRTTPRPDTDRSAIYESGLEQAHVDFAVRYSNTFGAWDLGLSHFYGTSRDPVFVSDFNRDGERILIPRYDIINQTGLELQYVRGSTAWKGEAFLREGQGDPYVAVTAGLEHTLHGVFDTDVDLGLLAEYLYESRSCCRENGTVFFNPFEYDIMLGLRAALNDPQDSKGLITMVFDLDSPAKILQLEASRRLGDRMRLALEGNFFIDIPEQDPLFTVRRDDFLQLKLQYYF